ncbi:hypothetical protein QFC21_003046 [Naganishia friedmannii]|uniref:Uncharacterized protein n=1 Tax=Naganishia friedmannii TaxID=89922 RepID=A0ACC2VQM2_9TREE|nr:hypothetical protein QFC21_003046 [Naganishia friedmannii]
MPNNSTPRAVPDPALAHDAQSQFPYRQIACTFKDQMKMIKKQIFKHVIHKEQRHRDMYSDLKGTLNMLDPGHSPTSQDFLTQLCEGSFEPFFKLDYQLPGLLFDYAEDGGEGALETFLKELKDTAKGDETLKQAVDMARTEWLKLVKFWQDRPLAKLQFWRNAFRVWPDNDYGFSQDLSGFLHWTTEIHLPSVLSSMNNSSDASIAAIAHDTPPSTRTLSIVTTFGSLILSNNSHVSTQNDTLECRVCEDIKTLFLPDLADDADCNSSLYSPMMLPTPSHGPHDSALREAFQIIL